MTAVLRRKYRDGLPAEPLQKAHYRQANET